MDHFIPAERSIGACTRPRRLNGLVAGELRHRLDGEMAVFAETDGDRGRILAASRRLGLHTGVSDFADVRGCAHTENMRWNHEIMKLLIARSL